MTLAPMNWGQKGGAMLHHPSFFRKTLARIADWLEEMSKSGNGILDSEAKIQWAVFKGCFIFRLLNDHKLLPDGLACKDVPLRSYPRVSDVERPEEFHRAHDLRDERKWSMWFITIVNQLIHNEYFTHRTGKDGSVESILFYCPRRPPRNEDEEIERLCFSNPNPRQYLLRLDLDVFVALLREAAAHGDPGMEPFHLTPDEL